MNNSTRGAITLGAVVAISLGIFFAVNSAQNNEEDTNTNDVVAEVTDQTSTPTSIPTIQNASNVGSFIPFSQQALEESEGNTLIFFSADWCPTCQALKRNLNSASGDIPSDLTILEADFDDEKDLKQQYGVTQQHTVIKVDANGNEVARDTGTIFTLEDTIEFSEL